MDSRSEDRYELAPIGIVESSLRDRADAPHQGDEGGPEAWLVFDPDMTDGIRDLAPGDEIVVLTWLHRAAREVLRVRPRGDPTSSLTGVFSTRSPDRPNPIGLHPVTVVGVHGNRVRVRNLEAIDGTPIVDVKPELRCRPGDRAAAPSAAAVPGAGGARIGRGTAFATDPRVVADQAGLVATAWSAPQAPASWKLTAAQFATLRDDAELLAIAAEIEPDRLPPLLFSAAATSLVLEYGPQPLREWFPRVGRPQPPLGSGFCDEYRSFCLDHRDRLGELCAIHRYQMNEVGRCAHLLPALAPAIAADRQLALVDIGTGAGLALHLDRYRYVFRGPGDQEVVVGDPRSEVVIDTELRGGQSVPIAPDLPRVAERIGIDVEPLDVGDVAVRRWLEACLPQEVGAVTRFHHAARLALSHPGRLVRGDAFAVLPDVLASIPDDRLVCLTDSYVHVFFSKADLIRFRELVDGAGAERDLDWISLDPLVPMGGGATRSVIGIQAPRELIERNRAEGVFGVLAAVSYREGSRTSGLLAAAHPGGAWLEWLHPGGRWPA